MSKRKLNLKDLRVSSFITTMENGNGKTIQGGAQDKKGSVNSINVCYANTFDPAGCVIGTPPGPANSNGKYCFTVFKGDAC